MDWDVWAIIVAAGEGRRFGGPKQFERFAGSTLVEWSVAAARTVADEVVLVVPSSKLEDAAMHAGCLHVVEGGATRAESVRAGLARIPDDVAIVVVHDAARPLASPALFSAVVAAVRSGAEGAIPAAPVADTVKRVAGGRVVETLDRDGLFAVQTPQAFRASVLRRAHADKTEATDDAALVEEIGGVVVVVPGETRNRKLTNQDDVAEFERQLSELRSVATRIP